MDLSTQVLRNIRRRVLSEGSPVVPTAKIVPSVMRSQDSDVTEDSSMSVELRPDMFGEERRSKQLHSSHAFT